MSEIAKNHMVPNPESTKPVEQVCLAAFFAQLHEVDLKPTGSTLC